MPKEQIQEYDALLAAAREILAPKEVDTVIYHSPCNDGFGAAYVASSYLGYQGVTYIPFSHYDSIPQEQLESKNILMIDIAFKPEILSQIKKIANKILILDHHKTANEHLKDESCFFYWQEHSGAVLAHHYFAGTTAPIPAHLAYIEDQDLFKWELKPESEYFTAAFSKMVTDSPKPHDFDFTVLTQYEQQDARQKLILEGQALLEEEQRIIQGLAKTAVLRRQSVGEQIFKLGIVRIEKFESFLSKLGTYLASLDDYDVGIVYFPIGETQNRYKVSLRSIAPINASDIAELFGGGGHAQACGFETDIEPTELFRTNKLKLT